MSGPANVRTHYFGDGCIPPHTTPQTADGGATTSARSTPQATPPSRGVDHPPADEATAGAAAGVRREAPPAAATEVTS